MILKARKIGDSKLVRLSKIAPGNDPESQEGRVLSTRILGPSGEVSTVLLSLLLSWSLVEGSPVVRTPTV